MGLFKRKWKVGDVVKFGKYQQDTSAKYTPIEWIVLDIKNGTALLISKYCLLTTPYCDLQNLLWEDSVARQLLNDSFFNDAFNEKEKVRIDTKRRKFDTNCTFACYWGSSTSVEKDSSSEARFT